MPTYKYSFAVDTIIGCTKPVNVSMPGQSANRGVAGFGGWPAIRLVSADTIYAWPLYVRHPKVGPCFQCSALTKDCVASISIRDKITFMLKKADFVFLKTKLILTPQRKVL